jgi:hypothetical protein
MPLKAIDVEGQQRHGHDGSERPRCHDATDGGRVRGVHLGQILGKQ